MHLRLLVAAVAATLPLASARDVFCHYMIQGLTSTTTHAADDVNAAIAMGIDAFALNVGNATAHWALDAIDQLFTAASGKDLKFFFSMDLAQDSNAYDFSDLINEYIGNDNYYTYNDLPFLSTFSAAGTGPEYWPDFLATLKSDVYFVPAFDDSSHYYSNFDSWLSAWTDVVDGVFSWETAWPSTSDTASNVSTSTDETIISSVHNVDKTYMIPLSSLQYKHLDDNYWYRPGEVNLPQRMTEILALDSLPEFVEIQTWNDAGESHYISELHTEGLGDTILGYANDDDFPHTGWQSLFTSFITAYKAGVDATEMRPPTGTDIIGSMWYRTILTTATCSDGKPSGSGAARDAVNWAIVVNDGVSDVKAQVWSNGGLILKAALSTGLNYFSTPGMQTGIQYLEVVDASYNILYSAQGTVKVSSTADSICNYNYQVAELVAR
ncbi:putative Glycoside hydrolase [Seiridium cardinale]